MEKFKLLFIHIIKLFYHIKVKSLQNLQKDYIFNNLLFVWPLCVASLPEDITPTAGSCLIVHGSLRKYPEKKT